MPTKRAILTALTRHELRAAVDDYDVRVDDRRVKTQLVDALDGSALTTCCRASPETG